MRTLLVDLAPGLVHESIHFVFCFMVGLPVPIYLHALSLCFIFCAGELPVCANNNLNTLTLYFACAMCLPGLCNIHGGQMRYWCVFCFDSPVSGLLGSLGFTIIMGPPQPAACRSLSYAVYGYVDLGVHRVTEAGQH